ncbi:MAG: glycosyltransferase family 2 protein [Bacteroides sp.]|nr:glycosyltransferase family 2 protein [Bacteroides sp.]
MKVSIIIPIYNVVPYLRACLQSVFDQTYQNIEVIMIDDCGTDNSMEIAEEMSSNYQGAFTIHIIRHEKNRGLSAARNTGINVATGEYLLFLDSDDMLPNDSVELLVDEVLKHPDIDFVIGDIRTIGNKSYVYPLKSRSYINSNEEILQDYLQFRWNVMACNKLIRREFLLLNKIYFIEGVYHEDMDYSFKLAFYARSMACCYHVTYLYLIRDNSISTYKKEKNYVDFFYILESNFKILQSNYANSVNKNYISNYVSEMLYRHCVDIIKAKNPNISVDWKINMIKKIQLASRLYNQGSCISFRYKVKRMICNIPARILYPVLKLYLHVRKLD